MLVVDYYTPMSERLQELDVELDSTADRQRGYLKLPSCPYRSVYCRSSAISNCYSNGSSYLRPK